MCETFYYSFVNGIQLFFKWLFYSFSFKKAKNIMFTHSLFYSSFIQLFNGLIIIIYLLRHYYGPGIVVDVVDVSVNDTDVILQITCLESRKKYGQINK